ncbi:uncharacterized protein VICG_01851 [Vittaforma corneae ATCC 50505]|uniref:GPI-anchor transamidase n=1 Tax=Vittaforma corneae (strain ATCC 50505) TaxID=993615 RepID=L2GLK1_VITCO|nr:uncharacterized protein VICG_01851 [Vittaforma corneae ATCC 50505]ELA41152.1 hypothetical protein VICG_01851 [Vittaforma corneae ATCC 50505]
MIILFHLLKGYCKTMGILINTSKNFFNYRHMSNIQVMHYLLRNSGLPSENILIFQREDPFMDPRNIFKDKVFLSEDISIPHYQMPPSKISEHFILNIFYLRHPLLYRLDSKDSLIFYMCGHAREQFFKVSDRYFIFKNDLMRAINPLSQRVSKILLILDTCQASSLIDDDGIPPNVCVISTSSTIEFSYSHSNVSLLGVSSIDEVMFTMYRKGIDGTVLICEYFEGFNDGTLKSTVKCHGNRSFKFSDFIGNSNEDMSNSISEFVL